MLALCLVILMTNYAQNYAGIKFACLISTKEQKEYSVVMDWIRCRLSFAILRSAILAIRGSRSSRHRPIHEMNIPLATSKGRIPPCT